jgi:hypothetical protein
MVLSVSFVQQYFLYGVVVVVVSSSLSYRNIRVFLAMDASEHQFGSHNITTLSAAYRSKPTDLTLFPPG